VETSPRIKVFDVAEADHAEEEEKGITAQSRGGLVVDWHLRG